jgi:hypothetical protein
MGKKYRNSSTQRQQVGKGGKGEGKAGSPEGPPPPKPGPPKTDEVPALGGVRDFDIAIEDVKPAAPPPSYDESLSNELRLMIEFDRCVAKHSIKYEDQLAFLKMAASKLNYLLVKPEKLVKTQNFGSVSQQAPPSTSSTQERAPKARTPKGPGPGEVQPGQTVSWKKDPELLRLKGEFRSLQLTSEAEGNVQVKKDLAAALQELNNRIRSHSEALRAEKKKTETKKA